MTIEYEGKTVKDKKVVTDSNRLPAGVTSMTLHSHIDVVVLDRKAPEWPIVLSRSTINDCAEPHMAEFGVIWKPDNPQSPSSAPDVTIIRQREE